jgi:hypothetical protein
MSDWYAPNQQAVRGDGSGPGEEGEGGSEPDDVVGYDPADHTVAEVQAYLEAHPDEADAVLALEAEGKNRASLVG